MPVVRPAPPEPAASERLPPPLFGVLVLGGLVVAAAGLKQASDIVGPFFLTLTIVIAVYPLNGWLVSRKVPQLVASIITMVSVYLLIIVVLGSVVWSLTRLATTLPNYSEEFTQLYNSLLEWLAGFGLSSEVLRNAVSQVDLASFAGVARRALSSVTSGLGLLALIAALVFFLVFDAAGFSGRIAQIRAARPRIADGLIDFSEGTRKYWVVTSVFGFIVAVIDVIALLIIGVPLAFTWGVLAFVTNYIPNVGFLIGMLPAAMIALLDGGIGPAIAVVICYCVINVVLQTLIQPRFTGDAVGVNPTVAFISLIFWSYLLGVLGALLAIPATKFVKSLLVDHSVTGQWFGALLNSKAEPEGQPALAGTRPRKSAEP